MAPMLNRRRRKETSQVAVIDIGASKIACFIARLSSEPDLAPHAEIVGVGYHGAPARSKTAASPEQVETGIRKAVDAAERMAGAHIHRVSVAVPGKFLRTRRIGVDIEIADAIVTEEDVEDCLAEGMRAAASPETIALHGFANGYRLDGEEVFDDPVGLNGAMLSAEMLGAAARQSVLDNLAAMVERCGLAVDNFIAGPYAAAEGVLIDDEKDLGVVLIDIGAGSTAYAVYDNGVMTDCGGVGVGGGHITKDIAQIFATPIAQAERIKTLYGAALIGPGDEHRLVDIQQLGVAGETQRVSRADLCEVIIPRMEEIFELVAARLPDDGLRRSGLRRAVITGGGSMLVGAREIAEKALCMKSRIGRPVAIAGAPETASAQGFAVCAGMIQIQAHSDGGSNFALGAARQSPHPLGEGSIFAGVEAWLRAKF